MKLYPSRVDADGLMILDQIKAALGAAGFRFEEGWDLARIDGALKGYPHLKSLEAEDRDAEFEGIFRSFDANASEVRSGSA